jgi:hypothetical protein
MPFSSLLSQLGQESAKADSQFDAISTSTTEAFASLHQKVASQMHKFERDARQREDSAAKSVDWNVIRKACAEGRIAQLSPSEVRAIVASDGELSAYAVRYVLQTVPSLRPKYRRRLFSVWGTFATGQAWDAYVEALETCSEPENPKAASTWTTRLRSTGPSRFSQEHGQHDISELAKELEGVGVRTANPYWCRCVLSWFQRGREEARPLGRALNWVMSNEIARRALTPPKQHDGVVAGRTDTQAAFVAIVLGARMDGLLDEQEAAELERILVSSRSVFGDPRLEASLAWTMVKELEPKGFAQFLERLVAEDLQFFFDHSMNNAKDRREFWLRYIPSIRQTKVILDRQTRVRIQEKVLPLLTNERLRSAFERSAQFSFGVTSAFCMWFDNLVVVEFSENGNAAYVYERQQFEKHVEPSLRHPTDVTRLKMKKGLFKDRWVHREGWERRFENDLRSVGIRPGRKLEL